MGISMTDDGYAVCDCSCSSLADLIPTLNFQLGDFSFTLPVATFTSESGGFLSKQCTIDIYPMPKSPSGVTILLGTSFMKQFTGSFNLESGSISLTQSVTSDDGATVEPMNPPVPPSPDDGSGLGVWAIIGLIILGLFLLLILVGVAHYCIA